MLLRDVMTPPPMRAGWGQDMAWPYPGIPKTLVAELAGYEVAGLPFFPIETVTSQPSPGRSPAGDRLQHPPGAGPAADR